MPSTHVANPTTTLPMLMRLAPISRRWLPPPRDLLCCDWTAPCRHSCPSPFIRHPEDVSSTGQKETQPTPQAPLTLADLHLEPEDCRTLRQADMLLPGILRKDLAWVSGVRGRRVRFPPETWNQSDRVETGMSRTNNFCESLISAVQLEQSSTEGKMTSCRQEEEMG